MRSDEKAYTANEKRRDRDQNAAMIANKVDCTNGRRFHSI